MSNAADIRCALAGLLLFVCGAAAPAQEQADTGPFTARVHAALQPYALPGVETSLEVTGVPPAQELPDAPWDVRVLLPAGGRLQGTVRCIAELVRNNTVLRRIPLTVVARTTGSVLVSARMLDRHTVVGTADVGIQRLETTEYSADPPALAGDLAGMRLRRIVPSGTVLLRSMFEPVPLVRSGKTVTIVVTTGAVRVRTTGVARTDGSRGGRVAVRPSNSRQEITGTVIGNDLVEVTAE
jgi:flagella basal body P-ring formation protein FlgA